MIHTFGFSIAGLFAVLGVFSIGDYTLHTCNNDTFETGYFVLIREVCLNFQHCVLEWHVRMYFGLSFVWEVCPLSECPLRFQDMPDVCTAVAVQPDCPDRGDQQVLHLQPRADLPSLQADQGPARRRQSTPPQLPRTLPSVYPGHGLQGEHRHYPLHTLCTSEM